MSENKYPVIDCRSALDAERAKVNRLFVALLQAKDALNEVCAYGSCDCDLENDDTPCVLCQCETALEVVKQTINENWNEQCGPTKN